jgi:hypothetical protein
MLLGLVLLMAVPAAAAPLPDQPGDPIVFVRESPRAHEPNLAVDLWMVDSRREGGIFLLPARGGRPQRLTRGLYSQPGWAPDGRRLAFRRGGLIGDVFVVDAGGGRPRNLTRTLRLDEREPDWRPR